VAKSGGLAKPTSAPVGPYPQEIQAVSASGSPRCPPPPVRSISAIGQLREAGCSPQRVTSQRDRRSPTAGQSCTQVYQPDDKDAVGYRDARPPRGNRALSETCPYLSDLASVPHDSWANARLLSHERRAGEPHGPSTLGASAPLNRLFVPARAGPDRARSTGRGKTRLWPPRTIAPVKRASPCVPAKILDSLVRKHHSAARPPIYNRFRAVSFC
jgi:hypothetical protein